MPSSFLTYLTIEDGLLIEELWGLGGGNERSFDPSLISWTWELRLGIGGGKGGIGFNSGKDVVEISCNLYILAFVKWV